MDEKLREMARQALTDAGYDEGRAMDLLEERDGSTHALREYNEALDWAYAHRPAGDLPNDSVVARTHVAYIRSGPTWYSTNGTAHTDEDIDRYLSDSRARVLRVGTRGQGR